MRVLLEKNFPELTPEEVNLFVDYSNGFPFYAELMAGDKEKAKQQPGTLTNTSILGKLLGPLYNDEENKRIILATAVFSRFGYFSEMEGQYMAIARSQEFCPISEQDAELRVRRFKKVCEEMQARGLLEKIGFSLSFRPTPLALRLAEEWWENCTVQKFQQILPLLKENQLVERFCQQFQLLRHVDHAKEIAGKLCQGLFNSAEVLNTEEGSRIFRSFVDVNPQACAVALEEAFGSFSTDQMREVETGRRNLIWALERLCFRADTFARSVRLMAAFAVAENEHIANNATQQFLQLFHIFLPGTEVNLQRRWEVILYCMDKGEAYVDLGIKAAIRALKSDHFIRMGGNEEGTPDDYQPSRQELADYWTKILALLEERAGDPEHLEVIADALVNNMYGLTIQQAGTLVVPVINRLLSAGALDWMKIRNRIRLILRSDKVFDRTAIPAWEDMLARITPHNLEARLKMYVASPSGEDYFDEGKDFLAQQVEALAVEFLKVPERWDGLLGSLVVGHVAEGANFGTAIGALVSMDEAARLIGLLLEKIAMAEPAERSVALLVGLMRRIPYPELLEHTIRSILDNDRLQFLAFRVASAMEMTYGDLERMIGMVSKGMFPIDALACFNYGWGLKHLPTEEVLFLLGMIGEISEEGKALSFAIAYTWTYNDAHIWADFKPFLRSLLLQDSEVIMEKFSRTQDFYYWSEALRKLLSEHDDPELAASTIATVIKKSNEWNSRFTSRSDFFSVLDVIQEKYFEQFWTALEQVYLHTDQFGAVAFHFRDLLGAKHDYHVRTEGLIFKGDPKKFEMVLNWAKVHQEEGLYWIAEWLPVFPTTEGEAGHWHPYALRFIDELGQRPEVLSGISAKIGTYSWVGSVLDRYQTLLAMFGSLLGHPLPEVRNWAVDNLKLTAARIEWEQNHETEYGL